jgi:hypothetical protein
VPNWRSRIRTQLSPTDAEERLCALTIAPEEAYLGLPLRKGTSMFDAATADDGYRFVGIVTESSLSPNRHGPYDAARRAEMQGRVASASGGSIIHLTQYVPWRAAAIVATVVAACFFGPLAIGRPVWPPTAEMIVAISVVVLMMIGAYARDVATNREYLRELLHAAPNAPTHHRQPTVRR